MTQAEIEKENAEVWKRVRILPLLTNLVQSVRQLQDTAALCQEALLITEAQEEKKMATTDALLTEVNRLQKAEDARAALDASTIQANAATIAQDQVTITDLQNHQVDDALVAAISARADAVEATLPPADPTPSPTVPVTVTNADGTPGLTTTLPAPATPSQVGDVVAVPVAAPLDPNAPLNAPAPAPATLDHTVTAVDPATGGLTVTPVPGATPVPAAAL